MRMQRRYHTAIALLMLCIAVVPFCRAQAPAAAKARRVVSLLPECGASLERLEDVPWMDNGIVRKALEGDRASSGEVYRSLLARGGEHGTDPAVTCKLQFWEELAARQGNVSAAYELGAVADTRSRFRCLRSQAWAGFALSQMPAANVTEGMRLQRMQMRETVQASCPDRD